VVRDTDRSSRAGEEFTALSGYHEPEAAVGALAGSVGRAGVRAGRSCRVLKLLYGTTEEAAEKVFRT